MLSCVRAHTWTRGWCVLMAMYLFNICADAPDLTLPGSPENLAYNDMESVLEIVLEQGLQVENAMPEHEDADAQHPEHRVPHKATDLFLPVEASLTIREKIPFCVGKGPLYHVLLRLPLCPGEVMAPPPERS